MGGRTCPCFCATDRVPLLRWYRKSPIQTRTILFSFFCLCLEEFCAAAWTSLRLSWLQSWNTGYWLRVIGTRVYCAQVFKFANFHASLARGGFVRSWCDFEVLALQCRTSSNHRKQFCVAAYARAWCSAVDKGEPCLSTVCVVALLAGSDRVGGL